MNYNPVPGHVPCCCTRIGAGAVYGSADATVDGGQDVSAGPRSRRACGAFVYENQILRTKMNYQFTRALSARVIVEYDSTLANPRRQRCSAPKQVQTQALLTWLPHPGTAVYVGWNNDLQNLSHSICTRSEWCARLRYDVSRFCREGRVI